MPAPPVDDVRHWVGATDWELSRAFYLALGWTEIGHAGGGLAMLELGEHRFLLQDYAAPGWIENSMITVAVPDAGEWYRHVTEVLASRDWGHARVAEPKHEDWGATVAYAWDPSGVLLHFAQFDR